MHAPGTLIEGKYEILGKIREGGMGAIYKVRHRLLDEVRVVKVLKPSVLANEELKQRFIAEAKTATRLKHPNICTIHDFALDDDGTAYLVMEFIDGVTLAELGPTTTPLPVTLEIGHQALQALGYLHRRSVVHRDIAPDNLMLTTDEEGKPLVKLIDLGIAKALDRPGDMTSTGVFLGKLKYASPEQYGALAPGETIDGRSDLYCLGIVLYELLTGSRPLSGDTPAEMLRAHLFAPPIPFEQTDPGGRVPGELRSVILKSLEKKREDRYLSAEDFDRDIVRIQNRFGFDDPDNTLEFVKTARTSKGVGRSGITPSAQDRLDRRFGAQQTPHPAPSTAGARRESQEPTDPDLAKTTALSPREGTPSPEPEPPALTVPLPPLPSRPRQTASTLPSNRGAVIVIVVAGLLALGVAYWLVKQMNTEPVGERASAAAPKPTAAPASSAPAVPATAVPLETREVLPPPVAAATEAPAPTRPAPPTARPRPTPEPRRPSEVVARVQEPRSIPAAPTSAPLPAPTAPPPTAVPPTAVPRPTAAPVVVPPPEPHPTTAVVRIDEAERVRETIRRWERAQNTLDADGYARVFPRVDKARIQAAFDSIRTQTVTFDGVKVDVAPGSNRATATFFERRVAVPRVGAEQRVEGNRTVTLRKDGESWVIVEVQ